MIPDLRSKFGIMFDITPLGIVALDSDGRIVLANSALAAMFGYEPDEIYGQPVELLMPEDLRAVHAGRRATFMRAPRQRPMGIGLDVLGRRKDGQAFPIEASLSYLREGEQILPIALIADITERKRIEQERDQLLLQERAARAAAEAAQQRQTFLAKACRLLASSLDYETTLSNLTRIAVPTLGDACMLDLLVDGEIQCVNIVHTAPEKEALIRELRRNYPVTLDMPTSWSRALRTGQSVLLTDITEEMLMRAAVDEASLRINRSLGFRSVLIVPLWLRDRALGVLSLMLTEGERCYNDDDMALAQELALFAAQAIENAQLVRMAQESARRTEETLALLDTLVHSAPFGFAFRDHDLRYQLVNSYLAAVVGYPPEACIGRTMAEIAPNWAIHADPLVRRVLASGKPIMDVELSESTPLGEGRQWLCNLYPVRTRDAELLGVGVTLLDISERKRAEQTLQRQTMRIQLLQDVAVAANQATAVDEALGIALAHICDCVGWPVGHVYLAAEEGDHALNSTDIWHLPDGERFAIFRTITTALTPAALDDLPGRVLLSGKPEWIADIAAMPGTPRTRLISDIGVRAGFAFPVLMGAEVAAVLEFFTTEPYAPDEELLDVMVHIGVQLGYVIERARVAESLRAAEAKYRTLVEQLPAIIYTADIDERSSTRYISPQVEAILGFTPAEWLADPQRWLVQIHPEDRAQVLAALPQAHVADVPTPLEYRSMTRDGRVIWLRDATRVVRDKSGRPLFLQGITLDITEHKQAEQALRRSELLYRTLARNFPNGAVFLFDCDLRFTIADGQALGPRGYTREMLEGKTLYEALSPDALAVQEPLYRAALEGRESVNEMTAGDQVFLTYYLPVRNEQGEIFAGMVVSNDITALKQAEQALLEERALLARRIEERTADLSAANAELARAARLKDEFLASMSHELRTPLNAVLGLSEALREHAYGPINDRQDRPLQMIEENGRHLLELINDILDLAKIGAGKMELEVERVFVETICQASVRMVSQAAAKKQISITVDLDPDVKYVMGDALRLTQILINLLTNAVKFTPSGGAVGLEVNGDIEQQALKLTVWDTGIGIPADQAGRLFQPFVQLDSRLARRYGGTGLGLALVARLLELHGGSISVSSEVNVGSRFTILLPYRSKGEEQSPPFSAEGEMELVGLQRALIIEDSATAANQAAHFFADLGIETETLILGSDAVTCAQSFHPNLILLDILLPDISGWEVLAQLKADPATRAIPVVISSVVDEQPRGLALGAAGYVVKPCTQDKIRRMVNRLFGAQAPTPDDQSLAPPDLARSILLVEDNEASILTVTGYLATLGYQVIVARNGLEALERARESQPALILMDIQMPELDGLETMRRMRIDQDLALVPIIAMTALAMVGDRERCLAAGANDYISKPIGLKRLATMIATQLQSCNIS